MNVWQQVERLEGKEFFTRLPRMLRAYGSSDFSTQQKAIFLFNLCILAISALAIMLVTTSYVQIVSERVGAVYLPIILPEVFIILVFGFCLYLLVRGNLFLASHLFILSGLTITWVIMWLDKSELVTKLDTVVFVLALLNLAPLFLMKYKSTIIGYIIFNISLLVVFVLSLQHDPEFTRSSRIDYFVDTAVAILFTGIVGYALFSINKRVLDKAMDEIKERERITEKVREHEALMADLLNGIPLPTFMLDTAGNFVYLNGSLADDYHSTVQEMLGLNAFSLLPPDVARRRMEFMDQVLQTRQAVSFEDSNKGRDFTNYFFPITEKAGQIKYVVVFALDITDLKHVERELEIHRDNLEDLVKERTAALARANEELQITLNYLKNTQQQLIQSEKMASLGVLSAGIAHEINNPLNFINGGVTAIESYVREHLPDHLPAIEPLIAAVHEGVKRSSEIVSSLNHYSRHDETAKTVCDIHTIIDNCLNMLSNELKNRIVVERHYTREACDILGNEGKLHQALLNIIANAAQSIENKGTISIQTRVKDQSLIISVTDTGTGISQENMGRIFDPFFTTKAPGKGTGLGLSIAYSIIQEHAGDIKITSEMDKYTKAIIYLPCIIQPLT